MAKGVSAKFKSYEVTVPALLRLVKLNDELKKHNRIVLKPFLRDSNSVKTDAKFVEEVLKFCIENKKEGAEILIAEGADGEDTMELFDSNGYRALAEKYSIGLVDLNNTENEETMNDDFIKFDRIYFPSILKDSFIISLPKVAVDEETEIAGSLSNMLGAFPAGEYTGFFSSRKNKIRKWPIKYSIHDILKCKMPNLAVADASDKGSILVGQPMEIDKQAAKVLGMDWKSVQHLRLIEESFQEKPAQ